MDQEEPRGDEPEVARSGDWMSRMLESALFAVLPPANIQRIFARMEAVELAARDIVVRQGDPGDYYYVIEEGYCEVSRSIASGRGQIHLADLGPGSAFGEEALISGQPRNASVTMLTDGRLMRLPRADFVELVLDVVLQPVDQAQALAAIAAGAQWLDVRYPEARASGKFPGSINIPLSMLRLHSERLQRREAYVVCSDVPEVAAIGAYLLGERGFDVRWLTVPLSEVAGRGPIDAEPVPGADADDDGTVLLSADETLGDTMTRIGHLYTAAEAERALAQRGETAPNHADTHTGRTLAAIVEELGEGHDGLDHASRPRAPAAAPAPGPAALASAATPESPHDELEAVLVEFAARLRAAIARTVEMRSGPALAAHRAELAAAQERSRRALDEQAARLAREHAAREQVLRNNYRKLMALAEDLGRQKTQIKGARRELARKLAAAEVLYQEIAALRPALRAELADLDEATDPGGRQAAAG